MTTWCSKIFFSDENWSSRIGPVKTLLLPLSSNRREHFLEVLATFTNTICSDSFTHSFSKSKYIVFPFVWKLVMSYPLFPLGSAIIFLFFESYSIYEIILSKYTGKKPSWIDSEFLKRYWLNKDLCIYIMTYLSCFVYFCSWLWFQEMIGN